MQWIVAATGGLQGRPAGGQPADADAHGEASTSVIGTSERGAGGFGVKVETIRAKVDADGGPAVRGMRRRGGLSGAVFMLQSVLRPLLRCGSVGFLRSSPLEGDSLSHFRLGPAGSAAAGG